MKEKDGHVRLEPEAFKKAKKICEATRQPLKGYVSIAVIEKADVDIQIIEKSKKSKDEI